MMHIILVDGRRTAGGTTRGTTTTTHLRIKKTKLDVRYPLGSVGLMHQRLPSPFPSTPIISVSPTVACSPSYVLSPATPTSFSYTACGAAAITTTPTVVGGSIHTRLRLSRLNKIGCLGKAATGGTQGRSL